MKICHQYVALPALVGVVIFRLMSIVLVMHLPGCNQDDNSVCVLQVVSLVERVAEQVHLLLQDRGILQKREAILMDLLMGHLPTTANR